MDKQKIVISGSGDMVSTEIINCRPYDVLFMFMTSLAGLVENGIVPRPVLRAGLDALSADLDEM